MFTACKAYICYSRMLNRPAGNRVRARLQPDCRRGRPEPGRPCEREVIHAAAKEAAHSGSCGLRPMLVDIAAPLGQGWAGLVATDPVGDLARSGGEMPSKIEEETQRDARWPRRGGGRGLERITVNLTPRSSAALVLAVELSGDTKTDTINRALQIYAYLEQVIRDGGSVHVREQNGAELERLRIVG